MQILESYEAADSAFKSRGILKASHEQLLGYLHGLANQNNTNTGTQHRDMIRGLTINHLLLTNHIEELEERNSTLQRWFIALAIASLIASAIQAGAALVQLWQQPQTIASPQPPQKAAK